MHDLAVEVDIETFNLDFLVDPETDHQIDDLQDNEGANRAVGDGGQDTLELNPDLTRIAFEQARRSADGFNREHAGEQCTDDTANAVDAKSIQRVVIANHVLEATYPPVAGRAGG